MFELRMRNLNYWKTTIYLPHISQKMTNHIWAINF